VSFIADYLKHTKHYESPTSFWKWSAYTTLAAILRDSVWIMYGDKPLYPNIYTLLLADSAVQRKDNPVRLCETLTQRINNTKVINGRSSIQGILDELAKGETDKKTGVMKKGGSAIWIAPEMTAGIVNDPEAIKILTDIYTFREKYDSRLRTQANFTIKNICFSFLAASNEALLRDVYDIKATMGGLLGRTFLVVPNEFRPANSLFRLDSKMLLMNLDKLTDQLTRLSLLTGEFEVEEKAIEIYEDWYAPFRASYEKKPDASGITGRIHTSILKIAMLLGADEHEKLLITESNMRYAIQECLDLIPNYTRFIMASGKSSLSEVATVVLSAIYESKNRTMERRIILQRFWNIFDQGAETLDKLITTLEQGGMIQSLMEDGGIKYKMTDKCVEVLNLKDPK
jgi:hypothetical protein